jgi:hypothetical protein
MGKKSKQSKISPAEEPESAPAGGPLDNPAVARCIRAWHRAYKKEIADREIEEGESHYPAEKAGNTAYLNCMPPLAGRENIRNFIACVTQALVLDVLTRRDVTPLLYAAQVAASAAGREPIPPRPHTATKAAAESEAA